jgi:hypothetical protein
MHKQVMFRLEKKNGFLISLVRICGVGLVGLVVTLHAKEWTCFGGGFHWLHYTDTSKPAVGYDTNDIDFGLSRLLNQQPFNH